MRLAWKNILHDRVRFATTVLGIAFAIFLMVFQGSLLAGFLQAASKLVDAAESDLWITARGVSCFDFAAPLSKRFREIASGIPGVKSASRIVTAFAEYRTPAGRHEKIALVGADPEVGWRFPVPYVSGSRDAIEPESVIIDRSNAELLDAVSLPIDVEINHHRTRVLRQVSGFASFQGCPYVFASYADASRYIGLNQEDAMYILLRLRRGFSVEQVKHALQTRLPDVDIWTQAEFAKQSRMYWVTQTGAGGGILIAAILGFLIGLMVVSQTIYATTLENLEEFATLKALGATRWFVIRVVLTQSLVCGVVGCALGLAAALPLVDKARGMIAWIYTPWWLPPAMFIPTLAMCCLAAIVSIRAALAVEPAKVFRA
jgi:putative ABC transport system permease protein